MKRILFFVCFVSSISNIHAQLALYNYQGDQAYQEKDYQRARSFYTEGLDSCDQYSIRKLTDMWVEQPSMRRSMQLPILKSFNCLKTLAEAGNPDAMFLLIDFYTDGIGIEKDSVSALYWHLEYGKTKGFPVNTASDMTDNPSKTKTPRKSLLSNRFCSFLTYTYSPTMPFGFTTGIYFDKIGGYVSLRTDSKPPYAAYECENKRVPAIEVENPSYKFNRERWHSRMITGGLLYPVIKNRLFVSAGGGYGKRDYYREIIADKPDKPFPTLPTGNKSEWCYNTEASYEGLTLEAGGMFIWKKLTVVGGVNSTISSTKFKDLDIYFGLGLTF